MTKNFTLLFLLKSFLLKKLSNICAQFIVKCLLYFEFVSFELRDFTDLSFIHFFSLKIPQGKKTTHTHTHTHYKYRKLHFSRAFFFFFLMPRSAILLLWFFKVKQYTALRIAPATQDTLRYQLYLGRERSI